MPPNQGIEEVERRPCRVGGDVAVAAELHVEPVGIADFNQRVDQRRKVDLALAEQQVLVPPGDRIVEVDVDQPGLPAADLLADRRLALAREVAHVEREQQ
jgi:hypothetical protein